MKWTHTRLVVCLSVRPSLGQHNSTREPMDGLRWNLVRGLWKGGLPGKRTFKFQTIGNINKMAEEETCELWSTRGPVARESNDVWLKTLVTMVNFITMAIVVTFVMVMMATCLRSLPWWPWLLRLARLFLLAWLRSLYWRRTLVGWGHKIGGPTSWPG
jgi:hypothetical protein